MKKLINKDFNKLSVLLQQSSKNKYVEEDNFSFFTVKKINSTKVKHQGFYKPISKIL